jgi:hypothetical protein
MRLLLSLLLLLVVALPSGADRRGILLSKKVQAGGGGGDISSGRVGWWKFVSDATDSSGNSLTGTLNGNAAVSGGALSLDGTGDYLSVGSGVDTGNLLAPAAISVVVWVNFTAFKSYTCVASRRPASGTDFFQFFVKSDGKLAIYMNASGEGVNYDGTGSQTVSSGVQTMLSFTYSVADGLKSYVNGTEDKSVAPGSFGFEAEAADFALGNDLNTGGRELEGVIPQASVYDRALSAAEIAHLHTYGPQ